MDTVPVSRQSSGGVSFDLQFGSPRKSLNTSLDPSRLSIGNKTPLSKDQLIKKVQDASLRRQSNLENKQRTSQIELEKVSRVKATVENKRQDLAKMIELDLLTKEKRRIEALNTIADGARKSNTSSRSLNASLDSSFLSSSKRTPLSKDEIEKKINEASQRRQSKLEEKQSKSQKELEKVYRAKETIETELQSNRQSLVSRIEMDLVFKEKRRSQVLNAVTDNARKKIAKADSVRNSLKAKYETLGTELQEDIMEKENKRRLHIQGVVETCKKHISHVMDVKNRHSTSTDEIIG